MISHRALTIRQAIEAWAHAHGVDQERPVDVASERALAVYEAGGSVAEACAEARSFLGSWMRHPANQRSFPSSHVA